MIGKKLSGYHILDKIGGGNTGVVYKALDPSQNIHVALKVLPNNFLTSKEKAARFNRETQVARLLSHAAIARMYSVGCDQGYNFIAMEYVDGQSYTQIIESHGDGVPLEQFFALVMPVLDGVAYAHGQNLVHRDLKPENLKVNAAGQPKVLDFGLVKFLDKEPSGEDSFQTMAGMVLGSAGYMSPEQAEGLTFDQRTDIFSLGVIMYQLLTGFNPFQANNPFSTITKILTVTPLSVELVRTDIAPELGQVVLKCLSKEMDQRYPDAHTLHEALLRLQS